MPIFVDLSRVSIVTCGGGG